jgi:transcriptional regulator with XRE-family HTH domain
MVTGEKTLLRKLRRERELTFDVLSIETGINRSRLSRGERNLLPLTAAELETLGKYFGVKNPKRLQQPIKVAA